MSIPTLSQARRPAGRGADPLYNVPNALTTARLGLAAVLFACISGELWAWALITFAAAAVTDWLDGYLARVLDQRSAFGRTFDPLVDKVLVCGAFVFLLPVAGAGITPWVVTVVVSRELLVTGLRGHMESAGVTFGADRLGKFKMVVQCATLLLVLGLQAAGDEAGRTYGLGVALRPVMIYGTAVVTALSGFQYLARAARSLAS